MQRNVPLDALRGLTIAFMIIVNNPGSWSAMYSPLRHAGWFGYSPTDLVFPFFLFTVGASIYYSMQKPVSNWRITRRAVILFLLGLFLNGWPFSLFGTEEALPFFKNLRLMGVLQRIALCYLLTALLYQYIKSIKVVAGISLTLLVFYQALLIAGGYEKDGNLVQLVDLAVIGENHMYRLGKVAFDPEGILSTLGATVTTLAGLISAYFFERFSSLKLLPAGLALVATGHLLATLIPVSKPLYTASYVIVTAGWAVLTYWVLSEIASRFRPGFLYPFTSMGRNAILVFFGSSLLAKTLYLLKTENGTRIKQSIYSEICLPLFDMVNASLFYSLLHLLVWFSIALVLQRKKFFFKV